MNYTDKKTILLVEDEAIIALNEKMILEKFGYQVITASTGEKAVTLAAGNKDIDLILMDIDLGKGIDGPEAASKILVLKNIPIVFLTSHSEREMVEKVRGITRYGYIIKNAGDFVIQSSIEMAFELFDAHENINQKLNELKENKDSLSITLQSIGDAVIATDINGNITRMNKTAERLTGWSFEEAKDLHLSQVFRIINAFSRSPIENPAQLVIEKGKIIGLANHTILINKNGIEYQISDSAAPIKDNEGKVKGVILVFSDVTEKYRTEALLRESEERFRLISQLSPTGIYLTNSSGEYSYVNARWCEMSGLTSEEALGMGWVNGIHPDDRQLAFENWNKMLEGKELLGNEFRFQNKEGKITWIYELGTSKTDTKGDITGYIGVTVDITTRKLADKALKENEKEKSELLEKLNEAQSIAMIGSWDWDLETNKVWWSDETYRIFEVTPDNYIPGFEENGQFIHPDDMDNYREAFNHSFKTGTPLNIDLRLITRNGKIKHGHTRGKLIYDEARQPKRFIGTFMDNTEQKTTEELLRTTLQRMNTLLASLYTGVLTVSEDGKVEHVNQAFCDLFNLKEKPENLVGLSSTEMISKIINYYASPEYTLARIHEIVSAEKPVRNEEIEMKDGKLYLIDYIPITVEGKKYGRIWHHHDLTDRKKAEEALRTSEEQYRALFENMINGFAYCKMHFENGNPVDFTYLKVNKAFSIQTGLTNIEGKKVSEVIPGIRESDPQLFEIYGRVSLSGIPEQFETYLESLKMWFSVSVYSPANEFFVSVFDVITERKLTEEALRKNEERLRISLEAANSGNWEWNLETNENHWSDELYRLYELDPNFFAPTFENWLRSIHPEDRIQAARVVQDAASAGSELNIEWRVNNSNERWLMSRGKPLFDLNGNMTHYSGVVIDITERKLAEEQIKKLLAEKELILKEVHHRIKNNMHTIVGLLQLQAEKMKDQLSADALNEASDRVMSMMVLYEKLYRSVNLNYISLNEYLPDLIDKIVKNFPNSKNVKKEINIEDIILDPQKSSTIGIIINELVTNAMKYAFIGKSECLIKISVNSFQNNIRLQVHDNGSGIPELVDFNESKGFGLMLVNILTKQLNGEIRMVREDGTKIILEFKKD